MKLGSKASYSNRNKSCSLVLERFGSVKLPASFNWVDHGVVTPIKHQGPCGSCVDFGTIATVEAAYHLQLGRPLTNFSEQDVVNCFANFGRGGCSASWADEVLEFIMTRGLVKSKGWYGNTSLDSDYKAKVLECDEKPKLVPEKLVDYCFYVNLPDDQKLMELVYNMGPVIVPISTYDRSLLYLKDAPYVTGCGRRSGGHVIAMVGWTEEYFILKNSWGSNWGSNGYLHLARNKNNENCNYRNFAAVPIFKKPTFSFGAKFSSS